MSKQDKEPIDLAPLAWVAFWLGIFGMLTLTRLAELGVFK